MFGNYQQQQRRYNQTNQRDIRTNNPYPQSLNGQLSMPIVNPLYDQHIMKPPKENVTHGRIPNNVVVYSGDRSRAKDIDYTDITDVKNLNHENASNYTALLQTVYRDVISISLVGARIPFKSTLINNSNNLLHFRFNDSTTGSISKMYEAIIPEGEYTITDLLGEISDQISIASSAAFTLSGLGLYVSGDKKYGRIEFKGSEDFELHFGNYYRSSNDISKLDPSLPTTLTRTINPDGSITITDNKSSSKNIDEFKNPLHLKYLDRTIESSWI